MSEGGLDGGSGRRHDEQQPARQVDDYESAVVVQTKKCVQHTGRMPGQKNSGIQSLNSKIINNTNGVVLMQTAKIK